MTRFDIGSSRRRCVRRSRGWRHCRARPKHPAAARVVTGQARRPCSARLNGPERHRHHRFAHSPQPARPQRAARLHRPGGHPEDRPQLDQRCPAAAAERGRRHQLASFNNSGNLGNPPNGAGVGAGAAEIDLRYLGSVRTLVLVDGLRFLNGASASGVPGSVDLNTIPESMIERVEVLQDGASTIYGSDAIAGVVNIITKRARKASSPRRRSAPISTMTTAGPRITS